MAKTYRDVAIDQMIATVEEAMSRAIDWWGDLPTPMNELSWAVRTRIDETAIIDSTGIFWMEFLRRRLTNFAFNLGQQSIPSNL